MSPARPAPVLALERVTFAWPGQAPCLRLAGLRLEQGDQLFLHGPSGSGKSTLLAIAGGVITPQRGAVRLLGQELTRMSAGARDRMRADHVGFIFQQFNLVPYLSALDNVLLPCRFSSHRRARAAAQDGNAGQQARRLLARLGIDAALQRRQALQLSVGQQQRAAAARALIGRPELVIADEPTSALDAAAQRDFVQLLLEECRAAAASLLYVSHDLRLAPAFSRALALDELRGAA